MLVETLFTFTQFVVSFSKYAYYFRASLFSVAVLGILGSSRPGFIELPELPVSVPVAFCAAFIFDKIRKTA